MGSAPSVLSRLQNSITLLYLKEQQQQQDTASDSVFPDGQYYCHSLIFWGPYMGLKWHFNQSFEHCLWETQICTVLTLGQDSPVLQTDLRMEKTKAIYKAFYDCFSTVLGHTLQKGLCIYVMLNCGATSAEGTKLYKCFKYRWELTWDIQPIKRHFLYKSPENVFII